MNELLDQFHSSQKQPEALRLSDAIVSDLAPLGRWNSIDQAATELRRLHAVNQELLAELQNIANADPRKWDEETRDQFQQWSQNRARAAIAKATGGAV